MFFLKVQGATEDFAGDVDATDASQASPGKQVWYIQFTISISNCYGSVRLFYDNYLPL